METVIPSPKSYTHTEYRVEKGLYVYQSDKPGEGVEERNGQNRLSRNVLPFVGTISVRCY